jgi:hypothetical protein
MKTCTCALAMLSMLFLTRCQEDDLPKKERRIDYYIESLEIPDLGFLPQLKVAYQYDDAGALQKYTVLGYNASTGLLEEQRHFDFSYADDKVAAIKGYLAGKVDPYIEYSYAYLPDNKVSKITEDNHAAGINSEANFIYRPDNTVSAEYTFSNGESFQYEFDYTAGNIQTDKTTRGSQICSDGQYTYDQYKNPFKSLGYVDYSLTNLSVNNKVTENVNYIACAFPTLVPESYTYEYGDDGYPVTAITYYKGDHTAKSRKEFFYTAGV